MTLHSFDDGPRRCELGGCTRPAAGWRERPPVGTLKHLYGVEADRNNAQYLCAVCAALVGEVVIHSRRIAALSRADAMTHLFEGELLGEDPLEQWKINGRTIYVFEAYRLSLS